MSWKTEIQVRDLDAQQKIEATCRQCGHVHYLLPAELMRRPELQFTYLDELERDTRCRRRGCAAGVRLALTHVGDTGGFVGGLA